LFYTVKTILKKDFHTFLLAFFIFWLYICKYFDIYLKKVRKQQRPMFPIPLFRRLSASMNALIIIFILSFPMLIFAQEQKPTFQNFYQKSISIAPLNHDALEMEDRSKQLDVRFAAPIDCHFDMENDGDWQTTAEGKNAWSITLTAKNATNLSFLIEDFFLPEGSQLYFFNKNKTHIVGPFTFKNNNMQQIFVSDAIVGDEVTIFYQAPVSLKAKPIMTVKRIFYGYKKNIQLPHNQENSVEERGSLLQNFGFATSLSCNINVNCSDVDTLAQSIKKSVVRITMVLKEGMGYCTGTLMNNTNEDGRPYILTGFHCQDGYTPYYNQWKFDFHYESDSCTNPTSEPASLPLYGCQLRAGWRNTDFLLLELTSPLPSFYDAVYSGWTRKDIAANSKLMMVHHPSGDIKKYSETNGTKPTVVYTQPIKWNNTVTTPANHHLRMIPTKGIFEVGSSGCGLFTKEKQLVGNLNGGDFNGCTVNSAYFGRLATSWNGNGTAATRLKDWLDPANTDTMQLRSNAIQNTILVGSVEDPLKKGDLTYDLWIELVRTNNTIIKDTIPMKRYFAFQLPKNTLSFALLPQKTSVAGEFLSTADLVLISKHILATQTMTNDWQLKAADANNNGSISTADIVEFRKVILGLKTSFDKSPTWKIGVSAANHQQFTIGQNGFIKYAQPIPLNNYLEFQAIRTGDVNGNGY
jgi:lysyl endopeptidase